jgi:hypothetical protein
LIFLIVILMIGYKEHFTISGESQTYVDPGSKVDLLTDATYTSTSPEKNPIIPGFNGTVLTPIFRQSLGSSNIPKNPVAYNADDIVTTKIQQSVDSLSVFKGVVIAQNSVSPINALQRSGVTQLSVINPNELNYILSSFINFINSNGFDYSLLEINESTLVATTSDTSLNKDYKLTIFLYEKSKGYVKKVIVILTTIAFVGKRGYIKVSDIVEDSQVTQIVSKCYEKSLTDKSQCPHGNPVGIFDNMYHLLNSLGLSMPFLTSEYENPLTQADISDLLKVANAPKPREYLCFGATGNTQTDCVKAGGFWDTAVIDDKECPFYMANKNYPNTRGGVNVGGYCQMPSGVQILGFRDYYKDPEKFKPECYNCVPGQNTIGNCCDKQSIPDYKFDGDQIDRLNSKTVLNSLGLSAT